MTTVTQMKPNDPLPEGHSIVVMQRFAEDAPDTLQIEMIVTNPDHSEDTSSPTGPDGAPLGWEEAVAAATQRAAEEGLDTVWVVDRTAGPRARQILGAHGDHSAGAADLADDDLEEGEPGSDMRDRGPDGAPRRF